jgi:preprotein translocase subunit SecG
MKTEISFVIAVAFAIIILILSMAHNQYTELKSMERNIESAIVKGIDPVAVKCAYSPQSTMCTVYAAKAK